ncbi:hypothetical protein Q0Z83_021460 [Actinoplanes sichuanensis]|nr:hypothetical protein Q0Z83_021460 [Actinoplanes sichuanensis]
MRVMVPAGLRDAGLASGRPVGMRMVVEARAGLMPGRLVGMRVVARTRAALMARRLVVVGGDSGDEVGEPVQQVRHRRTPLSISDRENLALIE